MSRLTGPRGVILGAMIVAAAGLAVGAYAWLAKQRAAPLEIAIAEIESGRRTTPLIGESSVTFLAKADGAHVPRIISDVTGWGEHIDGTFDYSVGAMTRVAATDWYSLEAKVASHARVEYLIAYGLTDYRLDPHNPRQSAGTERGGIRASEFVTAGYAPPPEFAVPPPSPAGAITEATLDSTVLRESCRVIVYTPQGYQDSRCYPVALFLDLRTKQISRVLDWLIAHREIEPVVAVFVGPGSRGDRGCSGGPSMPAFLNRELLAWVSTRFDVTTNAARRAIVAVSYGAKDALDAAFSSAASFGNVGVLIPGRRLGPADISSIAARRERRLRVAILAGQYDYANLPTARSLRDALVAAGHGVHYTEVPEGHSAVTWSNHLRPVLVSLFPGK